MRAGSRHTTEATRAAAFHERFRTHAAALTQATGAMAAVANMPVRTVTGGLYRSDRAVLPMPLAPRVSWRNTLTTRVARLSWWRAAAPNLLM